MIIAYNKPLLFRGGVGVVLRHAPVSLRERSYRIAPTPFPSLEREGLQ